MIIDATNLIAGRLASFAAKKALERENIVIINSEKAVITGEKQGILKHYSHKIERGDTLHGPFYPKSPERILRRMIRGMLPYQQSRGREAFRRVKCYIGSENKKGETLNQFNISKVKNLKYTTIGQLSKGVK